jgi:hypothetical protein
MERHGGLFWTIVYEPEGSVYDVPSINRKIASLGFAISSSGNCFVATLLAGKP